MTNKPDWEAFGRAIADNVFEYSDLDGSELWELAIKHHILKEVKFDDKIHKDHEGTGVQNGEPWFVYNFETVTNKS